jgi:hypothetical protein
LAGTSRIARRNSRKQTIYNKPSPAGEAFDECEQRNFTLDGPFLRDIDYYCLPVLFAQMPIGRPIYTVSVFYPYQNVNKLINQQTCREKLLTF